MKKNFACQSCTRTEVNTRSKGARYELIAIFEKAIRNETEFDALIQKFQDAGWTSNDRPAAMEAEIRESLIEFLGVADPSSATS